MKLEKYEDRFDIAGLMYYEDDVKRIIHKNPLYGKQGTSIGQKVYKYKYTRLSCQLVAEPDNPHDRNAIKIMVGDVKIGYIPAEYAQLIGRILPHIYFANIEIRGGDYKYDETPVFQSLNGICHIRYTQQVKTDSLLLILAVLGGWFGLHRYYLGNIKLGVLYTFTCGLCGIGWLVDIINILKGTLHK